MTKKKPVKKTPAKKTKVPAKKKRTKTAKKPPVPVAPAMRAIRAGDIVTLGGDDCASGTFLPATLVVENVSGPEASCAYVSHGSTEKHTVHRVTLALAALDLDVVASDRRAARNAY